MHRHRHNSTSPSQVVGVATLAALIGAATALLFTPRSGNQMRSGIKRRIKNHIDSVNEGEDSLKDRLQTTAEKVVDDTKSTAGKVKGDAKDTKDDVKRAARKAKSGE
jgi:gas vesicle protein